MLLKERLQSQTSHIRSVKEDLKTKLEALGIVGLPELPTFDVISNSLISIEQEMKDVATAKQNLINAIRGKGQSLSNNATWAQMVTAINNIKTGGYNSVFIKAGVYNFQEGYVNDINGSSVATRRLESGVTMGIGGTYIFVGYDQYDIRMEVHGV